MNPLSDNHVAICFIVVLTLFIVTYNLMPNQPRVNITNGQRLKSVASTNIPFSPTNNYRFVIGKNGGRLGNQLFAFAASIFVGRRTGRKPVLPSQSLIDNWFQTVVVEHINITYTNSNFTSVLHENRSLTVDRNIALLIDSASNSTTDIVLVGFFQSWKYLNGIEDILRRYLRPTETVSAAVSKYLRSVRPFYWTSSSSSSSSSLDEQAVINYWRIGIHVRAGDTIQPSAQQGGYVITEKPYFVRAMQRAIRELYLNNTLNGYHKTRVVRVQFMVVSESLAWVHKTYRLDSIAAEIQRNSSFLWDNVADSRDGLIETDVVYSQKQKPGFDMVILSSCDAVILTYGSFGWWSAWLANKTTIYYGGWPRKGSALSKYLYQHEYYPPNWISL